MCAACEKRFKKLSPAAIKTQQREKVRWHNIYSFDIRYAVAWVYSWKKKRNCAQKTEHVRLAVHIYLWLNGNVCVYMTSFCFFVHLLTCPPAHLLACLCKWDWMVGWRKKIKYICLFSSSWRSWHWNSNATWQLKYDIQSAIN